MPVLLANTQAHNRPAFGPGIIVGIGSDLGGLYLR